MLRIKKRAQTQPSESASLCFDDLENVRVTGRYGRCLCPHCHEDSAYFFAESLEKPNLMVFCNRQVHCGKKTTVSMKKNSDSPSKKLPEPPALRECLHMSLEGASWLGSIIDWQVSLGQTQPILDDINLKNWRGISQQTLKDMRITTLKNGLPLSQFLKSMGKEHFDPVLFRPLYSRDLIIPIYNKDNQVERLLLRCSPHMLQTDEKAKWMSEQEQFRKEVNLPLAMNAEAVFNLRDVEADGDVLFVTEGVPDCLSIKEVCPNALAVAIPGVAQYKALLKHHPKQKIVICFDNDEAGKKFSLAMMNECKKQKMKCVVLNPDDLAGCKDLNEFLQADREAFTRMIQKYA